MSAALLTRVQELAALRNVAEQRKAALAAEREGFERQFADVIAAANEAAAAVATAERDVRALAEAEYKETQEKRPAPGIVVQERNSLVYDDDAAFAWAKETGMALTPESLDRKAFEKIAKATAIPFVAVVVEPKITIATDLSAALSVEGA